MTYDDAVQKYGTDKPDLRYDMKFVELNDVDKKQRLLMYLIILNLSLDF